MHVGSRKYDKQVDSFMTIETKIGTWVLHTFSWIVTTVSSKKS